LAEGRYESIFERNIASEEDATPLRPIANLVRARYFNHRAILQILRLFGPSTRFELSLQTGLTKPTISNITTRLSELNLVRQGGLDRGKRGQPAQRLEINPNGAFSLGLDIDCHQISLVLADLEGRVRAQSRKKTIGTRPRDVAKFLERNIAAMLDQAEIPYSRVIGMGVAVAANLYCLNAPDDPPTSDQWLACDLKAMLSGMVSVPVLIDNAAAAAVVGETQHKSSVGRGPFYFLLIGSGLDGSLAVNGQPHVPGGLHNRALGLVRYKSEDRPDDTLQDTVSVLTLSRRLQNGGRSLDALETSTIDPLSQAILDDWICDVVRALKGPISVLAHGFKLDAFFIGGSLPLSAISLLAEALSRSLAYTFPDSSTRVVPASNAAEAAAIGAAALPFTDQLFLQDTLIIQVREPNLPPCPIQ